MGEIVIERAGLLVGLEDDSEEASGFRLNGAPLEGGRLELDPGWFDIQPPRAVSCGDVLSWEGDADVKPVVEVAG